MQIIEKRNKWSVLNNADNNYNQHKTKYDY